MDSHCHAESFLAQACESPDTTARAMEPGEYFLVERRALKRGEADENCEDFPFLAM
ncbi:MAG: hypothetical protein MRJ67_14400 [Nitrospirales bacterium]|nr:hypothetical protein [Nitrospirales bacterium]